MSDAATPAENNGGTPPASPAATPAATPENGAPKQPETVTLSKEEADQLRRDAARGASNQRKADLYDRTVGSGKGHFKPATPATPPSEEEKQEQAAAEDRKAERSLLALALDPAYRATLDADPTLRDLLTKNPLAVLPILAPDALDADDALSLVKDALAKRKPATPPATPPTPPAPATPPSGAINPKDKPVNEEVEAARKLPNTERAVAGMIGAKLRANAGKK